MRSFLPILALAALAPPSAIHAQVEAGKANPSDIYFRGYLIQEDGLKLLEQKNYSAAHGKLYEASQLFDAVSQADPNWEPTIVDYRRRRVRELMEQARIGEKIRREKIAAAKGTVNPDPGPGNEPKALPMAPAGGRRPLGVEALVAEKSGDLKKRIDELEGKNDALQREIGMRDEKLRANGKQMLDLQNAQNTMLLRLKQAESAVQTADAKGKREQEDLRAQVAKLTAEKEDMRKKLAETADLLKQSTESNFKTLDEVQKAYAQIKQLGAEKEQLAREKAGLEDLIKGSSPAGQAAMFAASNTKLQAQLTELEGKVKILQKERDDARGGEQAMKAKLDESQKVIATLQSDLEAARREVVTLKKQNTDYEQQMAAVQARLTETEQALGEAGPQGGMTDANAREENKILHGTVLKLMKQQAGRMKAKEQALNLLEQSGKVSQDLLNSLTEMAAPYQLSAPERAVINAMAPPPTAGSGSAVAGNQGMGLQIEIVGDVGARPDGKTPADTLPMTPGPNAPTGAMDRQGLPPELKAYATAAETHFKNQEFVQAEESYLRILDKEPRNVFALCNLAVVQMRRNKLSEVEVHLKKALAYQYDNDFPHLLLGATYLRQSRYADAMASIQEALKIKPANSEAHASLGFLHWQLKNYKEAEQSLAEAVRLNPANGDAHADLAVLYARAYTFNQTASLKELYKSHYRLSLQHGAKADPSMDKLMDN